MAHDLFHTLQTFETGAGESARFYSLPQLEKEGIGRISRLPVSLRILLESVLRNYDGQKIVEEDIHELAKWEPVANRQEEVPFIVARILLQDFTGVPLLVDLAAMRSAMQRMGKNPDLIEPLVPVDLVVDHSVQVDFYGTPWAFRRNTEVEFQRNRERYEFLKWGTQAFDGFRVIPPEIGIVHQVNLEYLARGVLQKDGIYYPDTLVGTDSHTTMINGLGIVGWGVGGIEAEAGMLGQPVYILLPDVVGVHMTGTLREGVTATDLVLHVTELLRSANVVGKFVEFHGKGAASLPVPDRATIANMAPEYGATIGYFPVDEESCKYLLATGRDADHVATLRNYYRAQQLFGIPLQGQCDYTRVLDLNLAEVEPSVSGPKRPQDRVELKDLKTRFLELLRKPVSQNGYNKPDADPSHKYTVDVSHRPSIILGGGEQEKAPGSLQKETSHWTELEMMNNRPTPEAIEEVVPDVSSGLAEIGHGSVLIGAITSCTNTSNPGVMLAAGLLAKKAVEAGLRVPNAVKTSLAPGSRVVTDYLEKTGLQSYLNQLGFHLVGYGCTTCIGNSGPLHSAIEEAVVKNDLIAASVLSGNRNFEARIHQSIKANFLMSPPLVVAFSLAGRIDIDLTSEPLGKDNNGKDVYLRDIWPSLQEIKNVMQSALEPETFRRLYRDFDEQNPLWNEISGGTGKVYSWKPDSTYIQEPPFFESFSSQPAPPGDILGARPLAIFGDSVTTDHISPAGSIKVDSPAGKYLLEHGVPEQDFNSYGSRRGNDRVMTRGTFANIRIKNLMVSGSEGGVTLHQPEGTRMSIYDAALQYQQSGVPLVVLAGYEYGTGSSRDWAAKGTRLLGVRAVIACSFERIHRSNLVGMGVLPCQFLEGISAASLNLDGSETFDITGLTAAIQPRQQIKCVIHRKDGTKQEITLDLRIDTPVEVQYYRHGGILPYVLRQM